MSVQLPRMGNFLRTTQYVIRCGCWRCKVPLLRKRHWLKLAKELEHDAAPGPL